MSEVNQVLAVDAFKGDNQHLISCIEALLSLDAKGALVPHGVGGHARAMLSSAAQRLADFNRVTAERDATLGREAALLKELHEIKESMAYRGSFLGRVQAERDALQALLTAADERADVQTLALREVVAACDLAMSAIDDDERCANFVKIIAAIKAKAALKPAEGGGDEA